MLHLNIRSIPHNEQRYETVGDWVGNITRNANISISEMGDVYKEFLVALHEQIEFILCLKHGIKEEDVTQFDLEYELNRSSNDLTSEPGDDPKAPYNKEHIFATMIERMVCNELGIVWEDYEKTIYSL